MRKTNNKIIKIEARLSRVLFPKYPEILGRGDNTYGIVSWNPMLVLEGEIQTDSWGSIVVKGNYEEEIDTKTDYTIIAKEVYDEQRGTQYELIGDLDTNTDTKVTQTLTTTNAEYSILGMADAAATANKTNTTRFSTGITMNPSTNTITASVLKGSLDGSYLTGTIDGGELT